MASTRRLPFRAIGLVGALLVGSTLLTDARGDSAVQFMTAKSLPDATVDVIDPESGTSTGTSGSDVNLAVGDIILFRFAVASAPASAVHGIQAYLTEYVPPGTELVGVRIVDEQGNTLKPRRAGRSIDGCAGGGTCNSFGSVPCPGGTCSLPEGSIAQLHADTGVFYTTDPLTAPVPVNQFLTLRNGIVMDPEPRAIDPEIVQLLNDTSGTYHAHNEWDWDQVLAYGTQSSIVAPGRGNTPFGYGSPVAGPDTYYPYEATDTGTRIELAGVEGPWERIYYPGSQIGTGAADIGSSSVMTRVGVDTVLGYDLTPASPVAATAVRFALGEAYVGDNRYVEVALRVTQVPIDPTFGLSGGNVDCGEVFGSDISSKAANTGGANNPWATYVASPQCVFLRLKLDLTVDKELAATGSPLAYSLTGKNLSVEPETNARVRLKYVGSDQSFVGATPPFDSMFTCPGESNKTCLEWNLGTLAPSDEFAIDVDLSVQGQGGGTNVVVAQYLSDELTAIDPAGYSTVALTVVQPAAYPNITLANAQDPTLAFAAPGSTTWQVTGTVANLGTTAWTQDDLTIALPTGWRVTGGQVTLGGATINCAGGGCANASTQTFTIGQSYAVMQQRTLTFRVTVPAGEDAGLYPIDVHTVGGQNVFGTFETLFSEAVVVPVGAVRTTPPVLQCHPPTNLPIISTQPTIDGTSEPDAGIDLLFNLIERGDAVASATGAWTVDNYLPGFGELYGGLEVRAIATAPTKLPSEPSEACFVVAVRECSDGLDNDGDGVADFPADPGCDSPGDNDETNPAPPQCGDGLDNDGASGADWPDDPSCDSPEDPTEDGVPACADGVDNDGDGLVDFPDDPDCASAADGTEVYYRACQDGVDNDSDGLADFPDDPGCHSLFDDDEFDAGMSTLDTKARLLIALDSSGSMNWNTCADDFTGGDGSSECPGADVACAACGAGTCENGSEDDSRLFQVKSGLANVVAAFGEVEYALMRFHQQPESFDCPGVQAGLRSGGWQGGGAAPCAGGFAAGDLLVSYALNNEATILDWINHDDDYDGVAPIGTDFEVRGSGTTPLAGILTSAGTYLDDVQADDLRIACRQYRVVLVTDGAETCGGDPEAAAAALLADGIPVYVIGFATPDPTVIANLDGIAAAGGTTSAIFVDDEAELSAAMAQIIEDSIVVERCNGLDDDCDGQTDEDFPDLGDACDNGLEGECLAPGVRVCSASELGTVCDAPVVEPGTEVCNALDDDCDGLTDEGLGPSCSCVPLPEICNDQDDDCDGAVDEGSLPGVGEACGFDVGECAPGTLACNAGQLECEDDVGPVAETCNTLDDDCDSFVDEIVVECYEFPTGCTVGTGCQGVCRTGVQTCDGLALGECVGDVGPTDELCNGLDDDCDGATDEGLGLGDACDNGLDGACFATGVLVCDAFGGTTCTAPPIPPGIEVCNNLDDDCDADVDEELGPPIGDTCGGGGSCSTGTFQCVDGAVECVGSETGTTEECNGADDDCDMVVDEDVPGTGVACTPPGFEPYGDTGICEFGHLECVGGTLDCRDYVGPQPEIACNGIDEDCDGEDEQTCPTGQACVEDACRAPCAPGEFPCPFGFQCETQQDGGRYCVPDPCADVQCEPGFRCDPATGDCYDLCDGVNCPDGTTCLNGICQDCFATGCPDGEVCVRNPDSQLAECVVRLCDGVTCDEGESCIAGECVTTSCDPPCPGGQLCDEGTCVPHPCGGPCPDGTVCDPDRGRCTSDPCDDVFCPLGERCSPSSGECIADPCAQVTCAPGTVCVLLPDDSPTCQVPPAEPEERVFAGGGGCAAGGGDAGGGLLWLAAALGALRLRRRGARGARQ